MNSIKLNNIVKGQVTGITPYGVFVSLEDDYSGLVHISEVSNKFVKNLNDLFSIGDIINVKVLDINEDKREVKLSIKKIDYKVEQQLSMIPESGSGFGLLHANLKNWTNQKIKEIKKKQRKLTKKCWHIKNKMVHLIMSAVTWATSSVG